MPRVYIFTIVFAEVIGVLLYSLYHDGLHPYKLGMLVVLHLFIYVNEKTSFLEGLLHRDDRLVIGSAVFIGLAVSVYLTYMMVTGVLV